MRNTWSAQRAAALFAARRRTCASPLADIYSMGWLSNILDELAAAPACGYKPEQAAATEPTALAVLALIGHARPEKVAPGLTQLRQTQLDTGMAPARQSEDGPGWPTSLAVLAWLAAGASEDRPRIERAIGWIERTHSKTLERHPDNGHNTLLDGWPWAEGTHAWIEPTALHLMALKATGRGARPRAREAVELLIDRQLPAGGCNYGNTAVFGQVLRPQVHPTGIVLTALAGEQDPSGRIGRSMAYVERSLGPDTAAASLAWGLIGLASHGVSPADAEPWLEWAAARVESHDRSPHKKALLALAALGGRSPLVSLASAGAPQP